MWNDRKLEAIIKHNTRVKIKHRNWPKNELITSKTWDIKCSYPVLHYAYSQPVLTLNPYSVITCTDGYKNNKATLLRKHTYASVLEKNNPSNSPQDSRSSQYPLNMDDSLLGPGDLDGIDSSRTPTILTSTRNQDDASTVCTTRYSKSKLPHGQHASQWATLETHSNIFDARW